MSKLPNQEWLDGLKAQEPALLQKLQAELSNGLFFAFQTKIDSNNLDAFIDDMAQASTLKILEKLDDFKGNSHFLTWAIKIAIRTGLSELRRARWKDTSLDELIENGIQFTSASTPSPSASHPETTLLQKEVLSTIEGILEHQLTHQQRTALLSILVYGAPIEEISAQMNISRNAVYKTIYDARKRLKTALDQTGLSISAILQIFS